MKGFVVCTVESTFRSLGRAILMYDKLTHTGLQRWLQDGGTFPDHNEFNMIMNSMEALILSRFDTF